MRRSLFAGAEAVVMGTRVSIMRFSDLGIWLNNVQFTVATESAYPEFRKEVIINAVDGGVSTLKYVIFEV
jgi:hypothetical protein